ncbi:hypoxia-inducible factor 1-alpha isoform X2 [Euwallacea similis]|uniref:hypoxia-inducible factor 1-alpha isoform X2 n=1 Tax=Euwallacea similis TaxID=1736056 RepID=UPI00344E7DF1
MCTDLEDTYSSNNYFLVGQFVDQNGPPMGQETMQYSCGGNGGRSLRAGESCVRKVSDETFDSSDNKAPHKIRPNGLLAKLGLPCQNQSAYDYEQCYSFYADGCYNTCQFVEVGDIEDFMNNEKRKERSRDAARSRRSRETEIFCDLGNALPISTEQISQLDKASVMRLAISYLRVRDMIKLIPILPVKEKKPIKSLKEESIFLKSLDGFIFVISAEGDFVYLSENVSDHLGISQIDLMGQNIYEYSHPCDHEEITEVLSSKTQEETDFPRSIFIRLKCTLTSKGRSVNLKSAGFKVIHCTGHMLKDKGSDEDDKNTINSCLVAVGQPIPHPSNIDTPLPRQTFLTKHSMDMKFTHADDQFMMDVLGYTSEDLIGKSVYEYHHAMDTDSLGSAYKSLFSKGQCETNRYRFLAKTGGFVWVVTQATLIMDKMQKPQSVVCVNYVISGVECKHEIYAAHQLACVKLENSAESPSGALSPPKIHVKEVDDSNAKEKAIISSSNPSTPKVVKSLPSTRSRPVSVTAKLFSSYEPPKEHQPEVVRPHTATKTIFAPRTEDMSKGFLTFSEEEPGLTMLKDEPDDLTHLAPVAGDVCVPLDDHPFLNDMLDDILLKDNSFCPLLTDEPSDPFISYRDYRDSSPQLLSPNLSKNSDCSLPSLSSPNSSLLDEDQMSTFMNLQMDDDPDLNMKAPYIPMNFSDDLPLLMSNDLMWNNTEKSKSHSTRLPEHNSTLAQMLGSSVSKRTLKASNPSWSTKLSPKLEVESIGQIDRSSSLKRSNNSSYEHQTKRVKNEPKEKVSSELLHQLMSNNHQRGRPKSKTNNWILDTGGKAACISQPSDSVLMNLLENQKNSIPESPSQSRPTTRTTPKIDLNSPNIAARKKMLQQQLEQRFKREGEARKKLMRKNSLSLLDPETTGVPSLLDLTQQDCEVNAPVNSSLLQGEELLIALEIAQNM